MIAAFIFFLLLIFAVFMVGFYLGKLDAFSEVNEWVKKNTKLDKEFKI